MSDAVNPKHYKSHPSGVEAIEICEHLDFCLGNALKYLWRVGKKNGVRTVAEDLEKTAWYLRRAVENRKLGHGVLIRDMDTAAMDRVIASEPAGSVLRDVLELTVERFIQHREPQLADALLRVERAIEEVTHA